MRGLCKANTHTFITVRMFYVVIYTQSVNRAIIRCIPASHDFWLIANFSTQNMRSPSNWTRFPGLWRRSNKFQLIVNFSKEFQLKVSDALVSCTLSRMHRKPLIWKVFSAFIRTPIKNSKKKIKHSEELNLVSNISLFLSINETKEPRHSYCQALYFNNPPKLMPDQTKRTLLKAAAHTGQCTPTHLH